MTDIISQFLEESNFNAAWKKVAKNRGCAGVDHETVGRFGAYADSHLSRLRQQIGNGTYRPLPLRQIFIPKKSGWRELGVPTVRDRVVQQALLNVLHPVMEPQFEPSSFAYRPGRSHKMAIRKVKYWHDRGYDWVLDADIVEYFAQVHHQRLLVEVAERLPGRGHHTNPGFTTIDKAHLADSYSHEVTQLLELIESWIRVGIFTKGGLVLSHRGIPQGAVISPLLANVYLDDFDEFIEETDLKLVRYADDFIILGHSQAQIQAAQHKIGDLLEDIGLLLHPQKTRVTSFEYGFRFLGQVFAGDLIIPVNKKLEHSSKLIRPASPDILVHSDSGVPSNSMHQAFVDAIHSINKPISAPLFVVLGYKVREPISVKIASQEALWSPGMSTLYLVDQNATLHKEQGRFIVKLNQGKSSTEILIRDVERILLFGNIQLSTSAIATCLSLHIPVIFLSQLGRYKGHLWSAEFCDLKAEALQFRLHEDLDFQLKISRSIVRGKLLNSKQLLLRLNRKRKLDEVTQSIISIKKLLNDIDIYENIDQLRGLEGNAAARYFPALGQLILDSSFQFKYRHRRPPTDPINSLLSFGYTLLYNNVLGLILAEGLNPYLGNLHYSDRKETHLAFDLMEEFRSPIVDSLMITITNRNVIRPTDFSWPDSEGGVYLTDTAKRVFMKAFEARLGEMTTHPDVMAKVSYRRSIQLQVQRYKRAILEGEPYLPYLRPV